MAFSTRSNPRLGQSGVALTSLGAVGGARGVSAGGLRILVEFLTTYNSANLKSLQKDLRNLEQFQQTSEKREQQRQGKILAAQQSLNELKVTEGKLTRDQRKQLTTIQSLESSRTKANKKAAAERKANLITELQGTQAVQGISSKELATLFTRTELEKRLVTLKKQQATAEAGQAERSKQIAATQNAILQQQEGKASLGAKLGGLAIGAIGGIVGGAILGVGFQLANVALEKVGDKLQDLIDPARHARDAVKDLATAVETLANNQNLTRLEAASQIVKSFGIDPNSDEGKKAAQLLAQADAQNKVNDALKLQASLQEVAAHKEQLDKEQLDAKINTLREAAKANGTYSTSLEVIQGKSGLRGSTYTLTHEFVNGVDLATEASKELAQQLQDTAVGADAAAAAEQRMAQASALAAIAQDTLKNAVAAAGDAQSSVIDKKIDALGTGVSARTRRLQRAVQNSSGGGGGSDNSQALADNREERQLLLLKERLRLMGTEINLSKYSGKFLLEAIDAKIDALNKQGDAQQRVNSLLDLQYKMSQTIKRNEGESINDFVQRRAQENRDNLQQRADLERQATIARLEARKEEVQNEVDLEENAEKKRELLAKQGTSSHQTELEKQLKASQKADAKALKARKAALEAQKQALQKNLQETETLLEDSAIAQTQLAITGSNTISKLNTLGGRIAGYQRAKATIQALVQGFGLPPEIAAPLLAKINGLLAQYQDAYAKIGSNPFQRTGGRMVPFAKGGIIMLNNSSTPFGSNARFGEQGTEAALILNHKQTENMVGSGVGSIGPFYLQSSGNRYSDEYRLGKMVRESVEAALR